MKNFGIAKKSYIFSSCLILLLTLLALFSWLQLGVVSHLAADAGLVKVRQLVLISGTELSVTKVLLQIRQALLFPDQSKVAQALGQVEMDLQKVTWPVVAENMQRIADGDHEAGLALLSSASIPALAKMQQWLDAERVNQAKYLTEEVSQIDAFSNSTRQ